MCKTIGWLRRGMLLMTMAASTSMVWGQAKFSSFSVAGKDVQVHGFFQQGFAKSTNNNFLTMKSLNGSFSMTDGGLNISSRLTPKLRVGAQAFSRNIGQLGNGKVVLDWAFVDYRFNDYLGVRGGKVKTTLGLFTDTQDMEFVHTWAILPQSVYPTDLRASTISHTGGDVYGEVQLKKAGKLAYTLYAGMRPDDRQGGYYLGTRDANSPISRFVSWARGSDIRWMTPVEGLTAGWSYFNVRGYGDSNLLAVNGQRLPIPGGLPYRFDITRSETHAFYGDFQRGKFRSYGEFWLLDTDTRFTNVPIAPLVLRNASWYAAVSYRVNDKVEVGGYYNEFRVDRAQAFRPDNGIRGPVVTARFDINSYWNLKAETHFIHGYGTSVSSRMFYPSSNPQGLQGRTMVFLLRSGFAF